VALKVLPADLARDPDRMARFQREAEVLASFGHPNIAPIFVFRPVIRGDLVSRNRLARKQFAQTRGARSRYECHKNNL
jgi:serine/threonine protein kinase